MFEMKKVIAAAVVCGGLFSAWYVVLPLQQLQNPTQVAEKNIRVDAFADRVSHKITSIARLANNKPRTVIFDNDGGIDDSMALLIIGNDPSINLQAITVNGTGAAHAERGAQIMAAITRMIGKPDVKIAYGQAVPIAPAGELIPENFRQYTDNQLNGAPIEPVTDIKFANNAVQVMHDVLVNSDDKVTILATGPLTNIALLIKQYPKLTIKIEKIVMMGGAVNIAGNIDSLLPDTTNKVSEWNFYCDPEAAHLVFASGVAITMVPLDATNQVPLTKDFYEQTSVEDQPDLKLVHHFLKFYVDAMGDAAFKNVYVWDSLAAMVMLDPSIAHIEKMNLQIDRKNGQVKVAANDAHGSKVQVVTGIVHPDAVLPDYMATLKSNHLFVERKTYQNVKELRTRQNQQENRHA